MTRQPATMHDGVAAAASSPSTTPPQPPRIGAAATPDPPRAPGAGAACGGGVPGRRRRQLGASAPASAAGPALSPPPALGAAAAAAGLGLWGFVGGGTPRVVVGRWARLAVAVAALLVVVRGAEAGVAPPSAPAPNEARVRRSGLDGQARGRRAFLEWLTAGQESTSSSGPSGSPGAAATTASGPGGDAAAVAGAVAAAAGGGEGGSISKSWLALLRLMNLPPDSLARLDSLTVADIEEVCFCCIVPPLCFFYMHVALWSGVRMCLI